MSKGEANPPEMDSKALHLNLSPQSISPKLCSCCNLSEIREEEFRCWLCLDCSPDFSYCDVAAFLSQMNPMRRPLNHLGSGGGEVVRGVSEPAKVTVVPCKAPNYCNCAQCTWESERPLPRP